MLVTRTHAADEKPPKGNYTRNVGKEAGFGVVTTTLRAPVVGAR